MSEAKLSEEHEHKVRTSQLLRPESETHSDMYNLYTNSVQPKMLIVIKN